MFDMKKILRYEVTNRCLYQKGINIKKPIHDKEKGTDGITRGEK
jgi:hypothetical protein